MVRMVAIVVLGLVMLADMARADEDALAKAMARDPDRFLSRVGDLIAGFGVSGALRPDGIETYVALTRAGARASALRRFLAMDLDADGTIGRAELDTSQRAASAATRGRMERQFTAADVDGDRQVDADELAAAGQAAGLRALAEAEADMLRALMRLDADGDGALALAEVEAALNRLDDPA